MKNTKKFVLIILVILGFFIVAGAAYYYTGNQNSKGTDSQTQYPQVDENVSIKDNGNSNIPSKNVSIVTTTSCESSTVPLIRTGERIVKQTKEDLDRDGIKELMVIYGKTVPGFEGMSMPSYRFTLFTCIGGSLVASYSLDSYSSDSFDFISYESGKAVFLDGREWYLLLKNGKEFEKKSASSERLQQIEKLGVVYHDGYHSSARVSNNKIEEILPGFALGDALCCPSKAEVKIIYEFKTGVFIASSISQWRSVTVNAREFKYPANWLCEYMDGNTLKQCKDNIINTHTFTFHLYPTSNKNISNSISFLSIDPIDNQCINWLKNNTHEQEACIYMDGGKNYAVYADSDLQTITNGFNLFVQTNKKN